MRSLIAFLILLFCASIPIWAQKNAPQEKSTVKKEYDENGNLIQFDSTYVWQWSSDSTFTLPLDGNFAFGHQFPQLFGEFNADSIFQKFGFSNKDMLMPFGDEDFFSQFQHSIPDSMFIDGFPFEADSIMDFQFGDQFPENFNFQEFDDLQKLLSEKFNQQNFAYPQFKSREQKEDWEKLMQKQQKEKDEMMKGWKEN
ncbi:hypothetical protein MASR2M47_01600 [Draconibacterium sp.]